MKNINVTVLWEKHRRFLLTVVGGLAVFFGLQSVAGSYGSGAESTVESARQRVGNLVRATEELDQVYARALSERKVIGDHLEGFLDKVAISRNAQISIPDNLDNASIDFARQKSEVWEGSRGFTDRARKIHLRYPETSKISFDLRGDLTEEQWIERYRKLEVFARFLEAALEVRVAEIVQVAPRPTVREPIPDAPKRELVRYPVEFTVRATFGQVRALAEYFQRDGVYLTIEYTIERKEGAQLEVRLLCSGIDVEEASADATRRPGGGRQWGRKPR